MSTPDTTSTTPADATVGRQERGAAIARTGKLRRKGDLWIVPSQSGCGTYVVEPDTPTPNCSCPDFETRQTLGGHLKTGHPWAVQNRPAATVVPGQSVTWAGVGLRHGGDLAPAGSETGFVKPEALAANLDEVAVMHQAIEKCSNSRSVAEQLWPVVERAV